MSFGLSRGKELDTEGWGFTTRDLPSHEEGLIDPRSWFADSSRPFELEIGSGKGTFLVQQGVLQPRTNFLGIEWAGEFYRYAADRLRRHGLQNLRMLHGDATEFIRFWCPDSIADVVHLYFSDPWPKNRHHKRRVVQDASLKQIHRILRPGGELRIVTDHEDLWSWCEDHALRNAVLFERHAFQPPESAGSSEMVGTNFERKFAREGRPFHGMTLLRQEA
jgi:tRNA (guanine-N7-)-methyltransferase